MKKDKDIFQEVMKLQNQWAKMHKANPDDPALEPLKAKVEKLRETKEFQAALDAEETRMAEELKKLFAA